MDHFLEGELEALGPQVLLVALPHEAWEAAGDPPQEAFLLGEVFCLWLEQHPVDQACLSSAVSAALPLEVSAALPLEVSAAPHLEVWAREEDHDREVDAYHPCPSLSALIPVAHETSSIRKAPGFRFTSGVQAARPDDQVTVSVTYACLVQTLANPASPTVIVDAPKIVPRERGV